ncbi:MAG: pectate lyase family protein [Arcticibacter sp.]
MKRNIKTESKLFTFLLLSSFLLFSCQKDEEILADVKAPEAISALASETTIRGDLDLSRAKSDGGNAFLIKRAIQNTPGDSPDQPQESLVRIYENGVEIGPAHSLHQDIRALGEGRFSHWGGNVYLSASDNSDPRTNGRKYTYAVVSSNAGKPQQSPSEGLEYLPGTEPIGYANVDGKTTGGLGGEVVTVTTRADLKDALEARVPLIVLIKGKISGIGSLKVRSNKSIIGIDNGMLSGIGLQIFESTNVIVQNLTIKDVIAGLDDNDCVNIKYSDHIWIDHCEFYSDRSHGWDYWDGLIDVTKKSNYITVSWSKLHDSYKGMLFGVSEADRGAIKVTMHHNLMYNLAERVPSLVAGNAHVFNNYFVNNDGYCIGSRIDGIVRTDNNYFLNCHTPIDTNLGHDDPGYVSNASSNRYDNSGRNDITTREVDWTPPYSYRSALIPADEVPDVVTAGAGATL